MRFDAFIGPAYELPSVNADCQRAVNLYPSIVESGSGKNRQVYFGTPGMQSWLDLYEKPIRGLFEVNGRMFAVAGSKFYEIEHGEAPLGSAEYPMGPILKAAIDAAASLFAGYPLLMADQWAYYYSQLTEHPAPPPENYGFGSGSYPRFEAVDLDTWWAAFTFVGPTPRLISADVWNDFQPVTFASNGSQILLVSGGKAWVYDLYNPTGTAVQIVMEPIASGTDLVLVGTLANAVSSASHTFTPDETLNWIEITGGTGWIPGKYQIVRVTGLGEAVLDRSPAALGSTDGVWSEPSPSDFVSCAYGDNYFFLVDAYSQRFRVSALLDGTTWDPLDAATAEGAPDWLVAILADKSDVWLFGEKSVEIWHDVGAPDFPYQRIAGGFIQQGCRAPYSVAQIDNCILWVGGDPRGDPVAWKAEGYQPQRISNHAIEAKWATYPTVKDAIAFSYEQSGHAFWVVNFPTADATWAYDLRTGWWHERSYFDPIQYKPTRHRARCHVYAFGKHLAGDRKSGKIYQLDPNFYTDDGDLIYRLRTAPHLADENVRIFYHRFQLDMETGTGATPEPADPEVSLRWSDDGGHFYGTPVVRSPGHVGSTSVQVFWDQLGDARDRVFEASSNSPLQHCWINAYLQLTKGNS